LWRRKSSAVKRDDYAIVKVTFDELLDAVDFVSTEGPVERFGPCRMKM
jgi:hypothetical protein